MNHWTEERRIELRELYPLLGAKVLEKRWGGIISHKAIQAMAGRIGLTKRSKAIHLTNNQRRLIEEFYPDYGLEYTAQLLGVQSCVVRNYCAKHKIVSKIHWKLMAHNRALTSDNINVHFFSEPNYENAYIAGYAWADGSVSGNDLKAFEIRSLSFTSTEKILLEQVAIATGSNHKIALRSNNAWEIRIPNHLFVQKAVELYGLAPNKSDTDQPYPNIPDQYFSDFLRGVLDGDGCVGNGYGCIYWAGSPRFIEGLQEQLVRLTGVSKHVVQIQGKTRRIVWRARDDMMALKQFLYPMDRKYLFGPRKKYLLEQWLDILS
jgi:hypothetical protein